MFSSVSYISSFVVTSAFNAFIIQIARFPAVYSRSPFFFTTVLSFYHKKFSSFLSRLSIHWTSQPTFSNYEYFGGTGLTNTQKLFLLLLHCFFSIKIYIIKRFSIICYIESLKSFIIQYCYNFVFQKSCLTSYNRFFDLVKCGRYLIIGNICNSCL